MPFGHTDYIPQDETRNFKALVPVSDEVKDRLDKAPSIAFNVDSDQYTSEVVNKFEEEIKANPLPAADYRQLQWGRRSARTLDFGSVFNDSLNGGKQHGKQLETLAARSKKRDINDINLPRIETTYRSKSGVPFRLDSVACHLFDQPIGLSHLKKLRVRLGREVVMLNDPSYTEYVCKQIQADMEKLEEERSRKREEEEVSRLAAAKKKGRYAVDEYFEAMHLPQLCHKKPWLWSSKKVHKASGDYQPEDFITKLPPICNFKHYRQQYKKIWAETGTTQQNRPSEESRPKIFSMDSASSDDLDDHKHEEQSTEKNSTGITVSDAAEDNRDLHAVDQMSQLKTVTQMFRNAREILENSREFPNHSIAIMNREAEIMNKQQSEAGEKDNISQSETPVVVKMTSRTLVQYIIIRSDLRSSLSWPLGAVIAQACHASTAALQKFADHDETKAYVADLENMTKIVLGIKDEVKLALLTERLENEKIDFVLWREKPENILTAVALRPYPKKAVKHLFSDYSLLS
ncbi:hypothetical protein Aperf_G00000084396 [Anoplocephala perfoliata]